MPSYVGRKVGESVQISRLFGDGAIGEPAAGFTLIRTKKEQTETGRRNRVQPQIIQDGEDSGMSEVL